MIFELLLDPLFERALLLLEELNVSPDLSFQCAPLQFEKALLLLEFLFQALQGWERHLGLTLHNDYSFMTVNR